MKLCPQCQHPMTDYWTFDACTFCQHHEKKKIEVLGKLFDPFDFDSLGDAIEHVTSQLAANTLSGGSTSMAHVITQVVQTIKLIKRLEDLKMNLIMSKAQVREHFLKEYGPFLEAFKQEYEKMNGKK